MRIARIGVFVGWALQVAGVANAQLAESRIAAYDWRMSGAPLVLAGVPYYPSGPNVFFDASLMVWSGTFDGVPIYVDATLEPNSIVYVPIGGRLLRPYERRRAGEVAGTVGSRTPSFPVAISAAINPELPTALEQSSPTAPQTEPAAMAAPLAATSASDGDLVPLVARRDALIASSPADVCAPTIESVPSPRATRGVWIEFNGSVWGLLGGEDPNRSGPLESVGSFHGFPVYQDPEHRDQIYVPSVIGGALVRYSLSRVGTEVATRDRRSMCP